MTKNLLGIIGMIVGFSAFTIYAQENPYISYNEGSGLITVYAPDFSYGITLQDKNLGAENVGDTGYYYQRGNNNPKTPNSNITGVGLVRDDSYNNHGYDGEITGFVIGYQGIDVWEDGYHDNVWGGGDDNDTSDSNIIGGYDTINHVVTNLEGRQGPCESGYHIPSAGEGRELLKLYYESIDKSDLSIETCENFYDGCSYQENLNFIEIMKLARGGSYYKGVHLNNGGTEYWYSSPVGVGAGGGNSFYFDNMNNMLLNYGWDAVAGVPIRCFKDSYEIPNLYAISFDSNGGENISGSNVLSGNSIELPGTTREYYTFSGWYTEMSSGDFIGLSGTVYTPTDNITLYAQWLPEEYTITYELDNGVNSPNNVTGYTIETPTITLKNPTKDGYSFEGWFTDAQFTTGITTIPRGTTGYITLYAKWTKIETKPSGGYSGGGGGGGSKTSNDSQISPDPSLSRGEEDSSLIKEGDREVVEDLDSTTPMDSSDKSSEGQEILSPSDSSFTKEQKDAYEFAKEKGITTMPTIQKADMNGKLTRIAMAKMLSQYAMNVLGQKPANIVTPKFNDVTDKMDSDYDDGVTLAYQLGIMGQNMPGNNFRPNDEVTRAEFATALSRMVYHTSDGEYKSTPKYYIHHMEKLVKEGIITKDDPNMKELRGYVMIMLMRSAKK